MNSIKRVIKLLKKPEMSILPGHLAFFLILSLFPLFSLIGVVVSAFDFSNTSIIEVLNFLPTEITDILLPYLTDGLSVLNITFIIVGLYVASNSSSAIILASNVVYKFENKHYVHRKIKSIFMTFWLLVLVLFSLIVLGFGTFILQNLMNIGILKNITDGTYVLISLYKYLIGFVFIFITIKIIYTLAPDQRIKSKCVNIGALFTTIGIVVVTALFSVYITNFARYDILYGNLANIVTLMLLVYLIAYIFILGIAINSNFYEE